MNYGLFISLLGSSMFGMEPVIIKHLQNEGYTSEFIVFWIFLISFIFYVIVGSRKNDSMPPLSTAVKMMCVGGVGMGVTTLFLTQSYFYIQTSTATLIHFCYPIVIVIIMAVLYKQKFTRYKLIACVLSFTGMLCITNFTFGGRLPGYILAVISAITYAFYDIANEKSSFADLPALVKMSIFSLGVIILFGVYCAFSGISVIPATVLDLGFLLTIGMLNCLAYICIMVGIGKIGASKTGFAATMEPVTGVILSILVYKDSFSGLSLFGLILIFISVFTIMKD